MGAPLFQLSYQAGEAESLIGELQYREIFEQFLDRTIPRALGMTFFNLSLYAGNSKQYVIYVKDRDLVPIDLTGAVASMTWRETKNSPVVLVKDTTIPTNGVISIPTQGEIRFFIMPADTSTFTPRQYVFDVTVVTAGGGVYTVMEGVILLKQPVTT